ncbi:MAG: acyltransferase [Actinomycetota bacterium]
MGPSLPGGGEIPRGRLRHGSFLLAERALTWIVNPYWRARILRSLGATVGRNARVYEARFFNLQSGFRNLTLGDDVHIGPGCLIDLGDEVVIGRGAVLSPRVTILTHADPGAHHGAPLARTFPPYTRPVRVAESAWIGANSVILAGSKIGRLAVVGANSLVREDVPPQTIVAGSPAREVRKVDLKDAEGRTSFPGAGS